MNGERSERGLDVVVVGAGLAGLQAARTLVQAGRSVRIIEAQERVGGRTLTERLGDTYVELGGQWIGPGQDRVRRLVQELGLRTFPQHQAGRRVLDLAGRVRSYAGTIPRLHPVALLEVQRLISKVERLRRQVPLDRPWEARSALAWDAMTVETFKQRHARTDAARRAFDLAVRAIFAAEPSELSFLHFLFYLQSGGGLMRLAEVDGGAQQERIAGGAQQLAQRLADGLGDRLVLGAPVEAIEQREHSVTVHASGHSWEAAAAIVATAPALADRIDFRPELPSRRAQLAQRMPMGSVIKCIATYDRPFWREAGLSGEAVSDRGPVRLAFDVSDAEGRRPALVGFLLGDTALQWSDRPRSERRQAVLDSFTRLFGAAARGPMDYVDKDWIAEPWSRGCYVGLMPPGTMTRCGPALREPCGRVHWAGTETARHWNGYLDGALESGERAAREALQRTQGAAATCDDAEDARKWPSSTP